MATAGIVPKRARQSWVGWVQPTNRHRFVSGGLHPPYEEMGRCRPRLIPWLVTRLAVISYACEAGKRAHQWMKRKVPGLQWLASTDSVHIKQQSVAFCGNRQRFFGRTTVRKKPGFPRVSSSADRARSITADPQQGRAASKRGRTPCDGTRTCGRSPAKSTRPLAVAAPRSEPEL